MTFIRSGLSRRAFLQSSAVAAAPLVMTRSSFARQDLNADTLKVGLIGCGGRGTGALVQALRADDNTVLWAMADAFGDGLENCQTQVKTAMTEEHAARLQATPERCFTGFNAYQELIDSGVDVVLLATPPYFRPAYLRAALNAGKHVFCEKPMAVDGPGLRSVMESAALAKQKNLSLVSGFCWRYKFSHRETWQRVLDGQIGEVQTVHTNYNTSTLVQVAHQEGWSQMESQLRNWKFMLWLCGDHIVEQACHSLDKQAWSFGDTPPERCTAIGGRAARSGEASGNIFDHFGVVYDYPNGAKAFHQCRQIDGASHDNSDWIWGTEGRATINGWSNMYEIEGKQPWNYEGPGNDMYQQEHNELFASIRSGEPINDGDWMSKSTALALMGRMAAYSGQTITWEQVLNSEQQLGPDELVWSDFKAEDIPVPGKTRFM